MKTLMRYLLAAALLIAGAATMQGQVLRDADFNSIGRINTNGVVRDADSRSLGEFEADGTVKDRNGAVRGKIVRLEIFDPSGAVRVGYISNNGEVRDGESNLVGTVSLGDGKVSDAAGNTLGYARGVRVDWIACYYLFHMFE